MPHWLVSLFGRFGYAALFAGIFLENLGVPVPGETVLLAAGFFAKQHVLRLSIVIPIAIVAAILGDNFGYWIGRRGGRRFVERRGKYIGLSAARLSAVEAYFDRHGAKTVFFARFISGIRVVAAIGAGVSKLPWTKFVVYNAAGAVAWGTAMGLLGYAFGQSWPLLERWVGRFGIVAVGLIAIAVLLAILRRYRERIAAWLPGTLSLYEAWLVAASLVAVGLLAKITEDVVKRESTPFDERVMAAITGIAIPGFATMMKVANALGSIVVIGAATIVAVVWLWRRGQHIDAVILAILAVVTRLIDVVLHVFVRGFPSGHAVNAVAIYGLIAVLMARDRIVLRRILYGVVALVSLATGLARIYLRFHWPTDILGGYCLGLLLLSIAMLWVERLEEPANGAARQRRSTS